MVFVVKRIQSDWATVPTSLVSQNYALLIGIWSISKPGAFLLAQIIYYGPLMIVAVFLWKPMSRQIREYGLGLTLMFFAGALLALDSESRHLVAFVPAIFTFVVKTTEPFKWSSRQIRFLAIVSVLFSKCWFTMNVGPLTGNLFHWPDQRYLMNIGPYMTDTTYLIQGAITIVVAVAIRFICFPKPVEHLAFSVDTVTVETISTDSVQLKASA